MNDNYLTISIEEFQRKIRSFLPIFMDGNHSEILERKDHLETVFPLSFQQLAEDFVKELFHFTLIFKLLIIGSHRFHRLHRYL